MSERRSARSRSSNAFALSALGALLIALGAACILVVPLSNAARVLCVALAVLPAVRPIAYWGVLIAAIPLLDFSTKTGWLFVNEYDAFFLISTGLTYIRVASHAAQRTILPSTTVFFVLALSALYILAAARALIPLQPWNGNAISNYLSPWHALYQLKALLYPLLTLPILRRTLGQSARRLTMSLALGCAAALAYMAAVALWERYAFTGIANFAADYRISLGISSKHVGSGTLETYLALAAPMLIVLLADRNIAARALGALLVPLAAYTLFVTFSRGLYAGIVVGAVVAVLCWLHSKRVGRNDDDHTTRGDHSRGRNVLFIALFLASVVLLAWQFPTSGYRGVLASMTLLFVLFAVSSDSGELSSGSPRPLMLLAVIIGAVLITLTLTFSAVIVKGPYLVHIALVFGAFVMAVVAALSPPRQAVIFRTLAVACGIGLIGSMISVARYWGGDTATVPALAVAVFACAVIVISQTRIGRWRFDTHSTSMVGIALVVAGGIAVALGAGFFKERVGQSDSDLNHRARHWQTSASVMLQEPLALMFGNGLGRYHALYLAKRHGDTAPTFWWRPEAGVGSVHLATGHFARGWGEVLRITQRVDAVAGRDYQVLLSVRPAERATTVEVQMCEKALMLHQGCGVARFDVPAAEKAGARVDLKQSIKMPVIAPRMWRPASLSFALEGSDQSVDVLSVGLYDARGVNLLRNSDFAKGMNHWFYTSDHFHLPWHAHNMMLTAWIDAGVLAVFAWLGLVVSTMVYGWSALRTSKSRRAQTFIVASLTTLAAVMTIGVFDSLIDIPRATTWMLTLTLVTSAVAKLACERQAGDVHTRRKSRKSLHQASE